MRLSKNQRLVVIAIYNDLNGLGIRNKCKKTAQLASERGIEISERGIRLMLRKYRAACNYLMKLKFLFQNFFVLILKF